MQTFNLSSAAIALKWLGPFIHFSQRDWLQMKLWVLFVHQHVRKLTTDWISDTENSEIYFIVFHISYISIRARLIYWVGRYIGWNEILDDISALESIINGNELNEDRRNTLKSLYECWRSIVHSTEGTTSTTSLWANMLKHHKNKKPNWTQLVTVKLLLLGFLTTLSYYLSDDS